MPRALVFYHFFHPDDVVSARHLTDLAAGLAERGWDVEANPCNRGCRDEGRTYTRSETVRGVRIRRVWRPRFRQAKALGRAANALWMLVAWSLSAARFKAPDVLIIGTDPILSILVAIPWKLIRPRTKIVHWCFDLYPEAAIADGALPNREGCIAVLKALLRYAYSCCDVLLDIGPCMRELLATYCSPAASLTITPWALAEPRAELRPDLRERKSVYGNTPLALMYSGNFGRAHSYEQVLQLAEVLRDKPVRFAFSVRGNRSGELRNAVSDRERGIRFVPFAEEQRLEARLSCADIHIVTLREAWTGMVVPSKFFGALAAGRPVLFAGSPRCSIARWIEAHRVGWVLRPDNRSEIAQELCTLAADPEALRRLFVHCHGIYETYFSRIRVIDTLESELKTIINRNDVCVTNVHDGGNQKRGDFGAGMVPLHRRLLKRAFFSSQ